MTQAVESGEGTAIRKDVATVGAVGETPLPASTNSHASEGEGVGGSTRKDERPGVPGVARADRTPGDSPSGSTANAQMPHRIADPAQRRQPVIHELKCWIPWFEFIRCGRKRFELRFNDRGYQVGDLLRLREYDPIKAVGVSTTSLGPYTGRELIVRITLVYTPQIGLPGLDPGFVILGIDPL